MKAHLPLAASPGSGTIACPVAGFGIVRATADQIAGLRRNSQVSAKNPLFLPLLKHADDQTVACLAAVDQAIQQHNLTETDFSEWGVVAAPSYLGRAALAANLQRQAVEGAWGISPHFIPHHSLHAVSGTISQVLRIHGPNFGIEASPRGMAEALTVTATLLAADELPGLWLVLSDYEPEYIPPDPTASPDEMSRESVCIALALALVPQADFSSSILLRVCPQADAGPWNSWMPLERVSALVDVLAEGSSSKIWRLGSQGWAELTRNFEAESGL